MADNFKADESAAGGATNVDADEIAKGSDTVKRQRVATAPPEASAAITRVNDAATNQTILAANDSRVRAIIFNDSTEILYLKYGTTATSTDFTHKLQPGDTVFIDDYRGKIDGIWANNASGAAQVTELA